MRPTDEFPDDPALPAIAIIRQGGLARALPTLHLGDQPIDLQLSGYTDGSPATFEVRAGDRHVAVKVYADDPSSEAELYRAMAAAGFAGDAGPRAPRLVAWERDLRILVLSWLDGEPVNRLIKSGRGRRAGELAAAFLWRLASLPIKLGPSLGPGDLLYQVGKSVAELGAADAAVGDAAKRAAKALKVTQPKNGHPRLVHGTLYARHILDLGRGDGPGVIDWQRYGQGPVEVDAGMFLATVTRLGLRHDGDAREASEAEGAFLEGTRGLVDGRTLAWYRAASLVHIASRGLKRQPASEARALARGRSGTHRRGVAARRAGTSAGALGPGARARGPLGDSCHARRARPDSGPARQETAATVSGVEPRRAPRGWDACGPPPRASGCRARPAARRAARRPPSGRLPRHR